MSDLRDRLIEATSDYGEAYDIVKTGTVTRDQLKEQVYELFDEELASQTLPQQTITVTGDGDYTVMEYVEAYHPGWKVVKVLNEDFPYEVLIQRDPAKMKHAFTNPETKMTYQRTVYEKGGPTLDTGRLQEEDPELWEAITEWPPPPPWLDKFLDFEINATVGDSWERFLKERDDHGLERQVKPSATWKNREAAKVLKYMIPAPLTVKVEPPRAANEEELAALEEDA